MKTPRTDKFYNVGQEWRGVPSPEESMIFARELEKEIGTIKIQNSRLCQTLSIARQTISDQSNRIDRLENKNFAADAGTVQQASTKGLSGLGGDTFKNMHGIFNYWHDASECRCQSPSTIGACLKCDMELAIKLVNHENTD